MCFIFWQARFLTHQANQKPGCEPAKESFSKSQDINCELTPEQWEALGEESAQYFKTAHGMIPM